MFSACMVGTSTLPLVEPQTPMPLVVVLTALFTGFMVLCAWCAYRLSAVIYVDNEAIIRISMRGNETKILWENIGTVDDAGQMLVVRDKLRIRQIAIENQIVGFDTLRQFIAERTRALREFSAHQLPMVFPRIRFIYILVLFMATGVAGLGFLLSFGQPIVAAVLFCATLLIGAIITWHSIEVDTEGLVYRYYFGRFKRIPIEMIVDSRLTSLSATGSYGEPHTIAQVRVDLKDGMTLTISGIRGGTMTVQAALQAALRFRDHKRTISM
ncbi:MAG: hypothetical protein K8T25_18905 [Planctomycetia bacterium]|nr:hypothetical protein [Planctomycetia bacterium]